LAVPLVLRHDDGSPIFVGASFLSIDDLGVDDSRLARKKAFNNALDAIRGALTSGERLKDVASPSQLRTLLWAGEEKVLWLALVNPHRPENDPLWPHDNTITVTEDDIKVAIARRKNRKKED
jgi:hypothetical protein